MTFTGVYSIANAAGNPFGKLAKETYTFTYPDETEFDTANNALTTDGKITINNIEGTTANTTVNTNDRTISITIDISENDINSKYGNDNFQNYSTIKGYFETTLGYTCSYAQK